MTTRKLFLILILTIVIPTMIGCGSNLTFTDTWTPKVIREQNKKAKDSDLNHAISPEFKQGHIELILECCVQENFGIRGDIWRGSGRLINNTEIKVYPQIWIYFEGKHGLEIPPVMTNELGGVESGATTKVEFLLLEGYPRYDTNEKFHFEDIKKFKGVTLTYQN